MSIGKYVSYFSILLIILHEYKSVKILKQTLKTNDNPLLVVKGHNSDYLEQNNKEWQWKRP